MNKMRRIRLFLWGGIALVAALIAHRNDSTHEKSGAFVLAKTEGKEWVEACIKYAPEVLWLADDHVRSTEENHAQDNGAYSEQLFGKRFIEFDRTLMTLHCLSLILDGGDKAYHTFTADQPENSKLTMDSFRQLHQQGQQLLKAHYEGMSQDEMVEAMEAALILGDMGKSEKARSIFKPYGVYVADHDDFYGEALQVLKEHPILCPTFERLSHVSRDLLLKASHLAHYGHITHLEGGPAMFTTLKKRGVAATDPLVLSFDLFVHACDVAGALGHVNHHSSLVYNAFTHCALKAVSNACHVLEDPEKTEKDAYDAYFHERAAWLGFDPANPMERVLTRVGAMLRFSTQEEGMSLKRAVLQFDQTQRDQILAALDVQRESAVTPTYVPAMLVNLLQNAQLGASEEERLSKTVLIGLPFISKVLRTQETNASTPLNFNSVAALAKTAPYSLQQADFVIDVEGNVVLKE